MYARVLLHGSGQSHEEAHARTSQILTPHSLSSCAEDSELHMMCMVVLNAWCAQEERSGRRADASDGFAAKDHYRSFKITRKPSNSDQRESQT